MTITMFTFLFKPIGPSIWRIVVLNLPQWRSFIFSPHIVWKASRWGDTVLNFPQCKVLFHINTYMNCWGWCKGKEQVDSQLLSWSLTKKSTYSLNPELTYEIDPRYSDDKVRLHTIEENLLQSISKWTKFDYKPICNQFTTTHYVIDYKTIHMYYLKKSHDSLNRSCD